MKRLPANTRSPASRQRAWKAIKPHGSLALDRPSPEVASLQRQLTIERRRNRVMIIGASLSLLCHIALMFYLSRVERGGAPGQGAASSAYVTAILSESELTEDDDLAGFDELPGAVTELESPLTTDIPDLEAVSPDASEGSASVTEIATLGASGDGSGGATSEGDGAGGGGFSLGGGGGGGTSFFGIASKGSRFAYIVDVSGSMGEHEKLKTAKNELRRSVDSLPDYSHFYVLLFSSGYVEPPAQKGWMRARKPVIRQFVHWLTTVDPGGGTEPRSSFMQVFALEQRPDVIFFLTDGQFNDISPEDIAALNAQGKRIVINTIQFGDPAGGDLLRAIARQSGGLYRFVPAEGM